MEMSTVCKYICNVDCIYLYTYIYIQYIHIMNHMITYVHVYLILFVYLIRVMYA